MSKIRFEAALCPVHRWTTEIYKDRCGVRNAKGERCGEMFSHIYNFLPLHEHDEALCDQRAAASTQPVSPQPQLSDEDRERLNGFILRHERNSIRFASDEEIALLRKLASQQPEEGKPKALTLDQKAVAEIEGAATGQCPFCEGGMDSFGGIHTKDCPMLARPVLKATQSVTEPDQQHGEVERFPKPQPRPKPDGGQMYA